MSDPIIAAVLTVLILAVLATWVPLLNATERMVRHSSDDSSSDQVETVSDETQAMESRAA